MSLDANIKEFESKLRSKGFEELPPFFVLRESSVRDERNGGTVKFDKKRLENIASIQNQRLAETGDATPIILGHTKRGLTESNQPPIVGYAGKWEVVKFFKTGDYGLRVVPWAMPGKKDVFENHPRRSVELWPENDMIDPISILGANTPRLDLGLHQLQRDPDPVTWAPRRPLLLEMDEMADDPANKPAPKDPASSPDNEGSSSQSASMDARLSKIESMLAMLQPLFDEISQQGGMGGGPGGDPGAAQMGGGMGGPPPGAGGPPPGPPMGGPPMPPPGPAQMSAGAFPGGGNTMMPQQYGYEGYQQPQQLQYQPQYSAPVNAPVQMSREQQEIMRLSKQVEQLNMQRVIDGVGATLQALSNEIVVDLNPQGRDFQTLIQLSRENQALEIAHWKSTRRPVEQPLPGEAVPMQFQLQVPQMQAQPVANPQAQGGFTLPGAPPIQLSKEMQAHEEMMEMVRNNKGKDPLRVYDEIMSRGRPPGVQTIV